MAERSYISLNIDRTSKEERGLRADVGEFAYVDRKRIADTEENGVIVAPFEPALLAIGSHRFRAATWAGVTNAPLKLPPNGHFVVLVADGVTKTITYVADTTTKNGCVVTRCAELVVIDGSAETWNYYVSVAETENNGAISVPSGYDKGRALDTSRKAAPAAYVQQYANLNRGTRSGQINFNSIVLPGNTQIVFDRGTSIEAPPTNLNSGSLRNEVAGCVVFQYWYPENSPALYFRERSAGKIWTDWEQATEGSLVAEGKVYVPSYARRGIGIGRQMVPVYSAAQADQKFRIVPGYGIGVTDTPSGTVVSWLGGTSAIPSHNHDDRYPQLLGSYANPSWITSIDYSKITNVPDWAGLYVPVVRTLSFLGTAGQIAVTGGSQSLVSNRSWTIGLEVLHTGLTGGSSTQVATPVVDAYGRVTSMASVSIGFPVTSVNGKTGAVSLSTSDVPEGTNLYWTTARGDARYPQLLGSYANPSWITSIDYSKITNVPDWAGLYVPVVRTLSFLGAAGQIAVTGGSQSLVSNRSWTIGLQVLHTGLTGGSSTQVATPVVDAYGRVTSMASVSIGFPVTSVNGKTGAVSLSTSDVPEGTNLYWTTARGDARYSLLGHTHTWSQISGLPSTLAGYGIMNAYTKDEVNALIPTAGVSGSGTANKVVKFTSSTSVGNSQITDDGSSVTVGSSTNVGMLNVGGAIFAAGNASAVSYYVRDAGAIRSFGSMYLDSAGGNMFFRTGSYYTDTLTLNTTGQVTFPSYTSSSAFTGTRVALLGVSSNGGVITISPSDYAYSTHGHAIGDVAGLQGALDGKTPWGHGHAIGDVAGLQSALDGKTPWGHGHAIGDVAGLQSALDQKLSSESDPWGLASHSFSVSGSTVTLGIQRRNSSQVFASFQIPSTSGDFMSKSLGVQNISYAENYFEGFTMFLQTLQVPYGIMMGGAKWFFQNVRSASSTPTISNDVIPVEINGVTRYILLQS